MSGCIYSRAPRTNLRLARENTTAHAHRVYIHIFCVYMHIGKLLSRESLEGIARLVWSTTGGTVVSRLRREVLP